MSLNLTVNIKRNVRSFVNYLKIILRKLLIYLGPVCISIQIATYPLHFTHFLGSVNFEQSCGSFRFLIHHQFGYLRYTMAFT